MRRITSMVVRAMISWNIGQFRTRLEDVALKYPYTRVVVNEIYTVQQLRSLGARVSGIRLTPSPGTDTAMALETSFFGG